MQSKEWTAKASEKLNFSDKDEKELKRCLTYDVTILSAKRMMTFQCGSYQLDGAICTFYDVLLDTSEKNARGTVTLQRVSYHERVILGNTGFMAIPIPTPAEP